MNQTIDISSSQFLDIDKTNLSQIPQEMDHRHITLKKQEPLKNELIDFLACIDKKQTPLVPGKDGLKAVQIAEAALESIKLKKLIDLQ